MQRLTRLLGQVVLGLRDGLPIPWPLLPRGISYPHFQRKTLCHPSLQGTPSSLSKPGELCALPQMPLPKNTATTLASTQGAPSGSDTEPPRWGWPQGAVSQLSVGKTQLVRKRGLLHVQNPEHKGGVSRVLSALKRHRRKNGVKILWNQRKEADVPPLHHDAPQALHAGTRAPGHQGRWPAARVPLCPTRVPACQLSV